MTPKPHILIVCTANQCRSPMAELLLADALERDPGTRDWSVSSAGTRALPGYPTTPGAAAAMARLGFDLSGHRSRPLTPELLNSADLVLGMTREHLQAVEEIGPTYPRPLLFSELAGHTEEIADPIGGPFENYLACVRILQACVEPAPRWLLQFLDGDGG